jgi:hypothetical protein
VLDSSTELTYSIVTAAVAPLSVTINDDDGQANLVYTWTASGPAPTNR